MICPYSYYRPQRSWAKVIFLHLSVILLTWGVYLVWFRGVYLVWSWGVYLADTPQTRYTPPGPGTPPRTRYTPWDQVHPPDQVHPLGSGTPPWDQVHPQDQVHPPGPGTPPGTRYTPPRNTDHERPVRILLECILV